MNKLMIIGNLTHDPETRTTQTGSTVCSFTVAVNRRKTNPDGSHDADFFRVSAWNQLGENCQKFLQKGRKVAVVGSVSVSTYKGRDGKAYANLEVLANDVEFLTPRDAVAEVYGDPAPAQDPTPAPQQVGFTEVNVDDELPF